MRAATLALLAVASVPMVARSQERPQAATGPIIHDYGPVFEVVGQDVPVDVGAEYSLVFDVSQGSQDPEQLNAGFVSLARFLNMHGAAGVPVENMHLALVIHGTAGKDALDSAAFRERFGVDNPNDGLLKALRAAGVEIYMCGQTAMARGLPAEDLSEPVDLALSAMTMLALFQGRGYGLVAY